MKKILRVLGVLAILSVVGFTLFGCDKNGGINDDNTFTVTFVDYDGTVLSSQDYAVGETPNIIAPAEPDNKENCYFTRWSVWESQWSSIDENTTIKAIYTLDNRMLVIGNRTIVFYSVFIMCGIMLAFYLGIREGKRTGVSADELTDGFLWIVPAAILGARLWYVAFEFDNFVDSRGVFNTILRIIGFSNGNLDFSSFGLAGLAIHGAFFTALVCAYFYCQKKKISILKVLDLVAAGFIVAQTFGRWGNFLNQEAHGGIVGGLNTLGQMNLSLEEQYNFLRYTLHLPDFIVNNMYIVANLHGSSVEPFTAFYHPTFFYELTLNWLGFFIVLVLRRLKNIKIGEIMSFYLIWYGCVRIFIESMRTDPLTYNIFGWIVKAATTTSVLMILGGVTLSLCIRFWWKGASYGTIPGHWEFKKKAIKSDADKA